MSIRLEFLGLVLRARHSDHLFFRPPAGTPREVRVHVCRIDSVWESDHIYLVDSLRASTELVRAFADLKQNFAATVGDDRGAYNRGKTESIRSVLLKRAN